MRNACMLSHERHERAESVTDATSDGGYVDSYVAFMDILGFSKLTEQADGDPEWRSFLAESIRLMRDTLPSEIAHNGFRATQFSDCIVVSAHRLDQSLFTLLNAATMLATNLFDRGLIMRGGIARGNFHHENNMLFGPALIRAHSFDRHGSPPHIALHPDVIDDIEASPYADTFKRMVRPDPWDLTPMLHTLSRFEFYPQEGDVVSQDNAETYSANISQRANDMNSPPDVRAKWRWMQDYWNRSVDVAGVLRRSD